MATSHNIKKEAVWVGVTQIAMVIIYAIGFRFVTQYYSPEIYGKFTLLSGGLTIAAGLLLNPLFAIDVRFFPEYRERGMANWFRGRITRLLMVSLSVLAFVTAIVSVIWSILDDWYLMLVGLILFLTLVAQCVFTVDTNTHSINRRQDRLALIRVLRVGAYPVIGLGLALLWNASLYGLLIATGAAYVLPWSLSRLLGWQRKKPDTVSADESDGLALRSAMGHYGIPFVVLAVANWVSAVGDRYLLAVNLDYADIGIYAAIYGLISQPYLMLAGGLSQWLRPVLFDAVSKGDVSLAHRLLRRWLAIGLVFSLAGGTILYFGSDLVLTILLSEKYHYEGRLILYLLIANVMLVATSTFSHHLMAAKHTAAQIRPLVIGATTNVVCNLALVPSMGLDGAGLATAISFSVHALLMGLAVVRLQSDAMVTSR